MNATHNLNPIIQLEDVENYTPDNNFYQMSEDDDNLTDETASIHTVDPERLEISVVNITVTSETNINIYKMQNTNTNVLEINDDFEKNSSKINEYSKRLLVNNGEDIIKGRIFQNGKLMLYTKSMKVTSIFDKVISEIKKFYCEYSANFKNLNYSITNCNCLFQFEIPFLMCYEKIGKIFYQGIKLSHEKRVTEVSNVKPRKKLDSGFLFYTKNENGFLFSFTIFFTGKVQARGTGDLLALEELTKECNLIYEKILSFRALIEGKMFEIRENRPPKKVSKSKKIIGSK